MNFFNNKSTLLLRQIIGARFNIPAHQVRPDDFKVLMSYMSMQDLKALSPEEVDAFVAEGRRNTLFRNGGSHG